MNVRIIHPSELLSDEASQWEAIRQNDGRFSSPYYSYDFTRAVGECRADARVIVADGVAGPRVFIPVHITGVGLARPIGAPFSDSNGPIFCAGDEALIPEILKQAGVFAFRYNGVEDSAGEFQSFHRNAFEAYYADLGIGFDDYLEARRSAYPKHFKKARRLGRQAAREAGELELRFHEDATETLDSLIIWKREQYRRTGLHDVLAPKWARDMLRKLHKIESDSISGVLTTLRIGGQLAAAEFGLRSGEVLHGWISAYNPSFSSYSPGMLLQQRLLEAAFESGITRADLGSGAGHYKKYYASNTIELHDGVIPSNGVIGAARGAFSNAWHSIEHAKLGSASDYAGKIRRRLDNILAVETTLGGRMRGFARAFNRSG